MPKSSPAHKNNQTTQSAGRHGPTDKALHIFRQQGAGLDAGAPSYHAAAEAACGPWQATYNGQAQLDREGASDGTYCRAAINALQVIVERRWEVAADGCLRGAATELLARGGLAPEAQALLEDIRGTGRICGKRCPCEAFDHYLIITHRDGSVQAWGLGLQTRLPKLRQHHSLPQVERTVFAAQQGVVQHRQLAVLYSGFGMRCLAYSELPAPDSGGKRSAAVMEELEVRAEEEGLSVEDTELLYGHMFDAAPFPSADNMHEFLRDRLLPKLVAVVPLPDQSAATGLPYPSTFSSEHNRKSALVLERALRVLQSLPPGWEAQRSSQEVERPRCTFVFPPKDWQPRPCSLADARALAMVPLPFQELAALLGPSAGPLGGLALQAQQMLAHADGIGIGEGLQVVEHASAALRVCLERLEQGEGIGAAAAAAIGTPGDAEGER